MSTYFNITVIAEWLALITAMSFLGKRSGAWQFFKLLLMATVAVETYGWYAWNVKHVANNSLPFNFLMTVSVMFFTWLFTFPKNMRSKKPLLAICMLIFLLFAIINLCFLQGFYIYNSFTELLGDVLLASVSFYFLFSILREDDFSDLFSNKYFWLANAVLFSSLGSALLYLSLDTLVNYYKHTHINVYGIINYIVNLLLYGNLILAFLCHRKTTSL